MKRLFQDAIVQSERGQTDMGSKTLHIAPGDFAGGSLLAALRDAGRDDDVLPFPDDLSCGPIDADDPSARTRWWDRVYADWGLEQSLTGFWDTVAAHDGRLVVWFGRHSASELAFFLHWVERVGSQPYDIVDVTGLRLPYIGRDGLPAVTKPCRALSIIPTDALKPLRDHASPYCHPEREQAARRWRDLKAENAPFRIVTDAGLSSAGEDVFDSLILEQTSSDWQIMARVIGSTMGFNFEPYLQVGDLMLHARVVALIASGRLSADGDPWEMRSCRVKLPD